MRRNRHTYISTFDLPHALTERKWLWQRLAEYNIVIGAACIFFSFLSIDSESRWPDSIIRSEWQSLYQIRPLAMLTCINPEEVLHQNFAADKTRFYSFFQKTISRVASTTRSLCTEIRARLHCWSCETLLFKFSRCVGGDHANERCSAGWVMMYRWHRKEP